MAKVERVLLANGGEHKIECGLRSDSTSPAHEFLEALEAGVWEPDPDAVRLPDEAQVKDYDKFLAWFQILADEGVPPYGGAINYLDDGVWEFKLAKKRLSYYDTDGLGGYEPKPKIRDRRSSPFADDESWWWYPRLDFCLRLGFAFPKTGPKAGQFNVQECICVREEDIEHDRDDST